MIRNITLKFGRIPESSPETINITPVTVFVGPNNSGKSKVLLEIEKYCRKGAIGTDAVIIDKIVFEGLSEDIARLKLKQLWRPPSPNDVLRENEIILGSSRYGSVRIDYDQILEIIKNPNDNNLQAFCSAFLTHSTLMLNGQNRIGLVKEQNGGDLQKTPQSSFQVLLKDDAKRKEVRRIIFEAFNSYFVIDPTNLGKLRIRLSPRAPNECLEERGIHKEAIEFHANSLLIDTLSDGVKAFCGIITEVIAGDPRVILIDEPEAFLHPSLSHKLGLEVSHAALEEEKRVFASTHSPTFVMGCIQSGAPVTIIRLTYRDNVATARVLPSEEILELMRHPLLRSTGVLSGLFYEFVVVTESDSDRAFYQEINERLLQFKPEWGIPNCLFINAQNKQTIQTIIRPLRKLGIPAAGIVDVDLFKDGGSPWKDLLSSANVPAISIEPLSSLRAKLKNALDSSGRDMKKEGGIDILETSEKEAAESLLSQLADYGIFVVPGGELESWMKHLNANGHGPSWLVDIFEKMGSDPNNTCYEKPTDGDVWGFISIIKDWLVDANRKGISE